MYVRAGRPAFARPCVGVHKNTSLMSSSLLLQQCPACLVRLTWIVFVIGGRWPYSWCLVGCYIYIYIFKSDLKQQPKNKIRVHILGEAACVSFSIHLIQYPWIIYIYIYIERERGWETRVEWWLLWKGLNPTSQIKSWFCFFFVFHFTLTLFAKGLISLQPWVNSELYWAFQPLQDSHSWRKKTSKFRTCGVLFEESVVLWYTILLLSAHPQSLASSSQFSPLKSNHLCNPSSTWGVKIVWPYELDWRIY